MAEERIDIQVTDKGADKAARNLRSIAINAEQGANYVDRLRAALSSLPSSQLTVLGASSKMVASDLKAISASVATLEADLSSLSSRANGAASSLNTLASAQQRAASATTAAGRATADSAAKTNAAAAATRKYSNDLNKVGNSAKLAGHHQANLVAQINDIGVSLASGQNPFIVLIQQGSQLQDLSMRVEGGFKTLAAATYRMLAPFAAAAAVVGVLYAKFRIWQDAVNDDAGLKEYANTLGLTKKEMKELEDVTVTAGDVMSGVWQTIKEALNLDGPLQTLKDAFVGTIDFIWQVLKNFSFSLTALFSGTFKTVVTLWNQFPAAFMDIFARAVNGAVGWLEGLANKTIDVLNSLGGNFDHVVLKRMENANAGAAGRMGQEIVDNYVGAFREAESNYNRFVKRVEENTKKAARNRLAAQAKAIIEDRADKRTPKGREDKTAENRAHALAQVNLQLDNELSRMKLLKDERVVQQRMDQIEQSLASKKIQLNEQEKASILAKVQAIQDYARVQQAADRIMQEVLGPQQDMEASIDAATDLYDAGKISVERYSQELQKATRTYEEATDPLFKFNEAIDAQTRVLGKYGVELERANYLEQIRQEYQSRGMSIYDEATGKIRAEVAALVAKNDALRQQQFIQDQVGAVLEPIMQESMEIANKQAVYAELERLRQEDIIREDEYQRAKLNLDMKYSEQRLQAQSDFFGALASITSQGTGVIGAISKAAAVAQATIDGYVAVQKALASAPPPWNYVAAAAVALKTGAQVAGIMSTNVGSYKDGGQFIVKGRDGVDANNINMNVTKGERVTIETPAQQRAADSGQGGGGANVTVPVKVVNQWDRESVLGEIDSDEGEQVIVNIIARNRGQVNGVLQGS